jgi:hypothetical protein
MGWFLKLSGLAQIGSIIALALSLWAGYAVFFAKHDAKVIEQHEAKITIQEDKKVKEDAKQIEDAYNKPISNAVTQSVDRMLKAAGSADQLQGAGEYPPDAENIGAGGADLGASDGLSVDEVGTDPEETDPLPEVTCPPAWSTDLMQYVPVPCEVASP